MTVAKISDCVTFGSIRSNTVTHTHTTPTSSIYGVTIPGHSSAYWSDYPLCKVQLVGQSIGSGFNCMLEGCVENHFPTSMLEVRTEVHSHMYLLSYLKVMWSLL